MFAMIKDLTRLRAQRYYFFFFNHQPTTEIYTLSLHDALPIYDALGDGAARRRADRPHHHHARTRSGIGLEPKQVSDLPPSSPRRRGSRVAGDTGAIMRTPSE